MAKIIKVFTPFTLSAVMLVQLVHESLGPDEYVVLKVYDRRVATEYRQDQGLDPWTSEVEDTYRHFVLDGHASDLLMRLRSDEDSLEQEDEAWDIEGNETWNVVENEAYLNNEMFSFRRTEMEVYQRNKEIQRRDISYFLMPVVLPHIGPPDDPDSSGDEDIDRPTITNIYEDEALQLPGILLEYIPGFHLSELAIHAPKEKWQQIGEEAISIIHKIGELGILNEDVKLRNFLVRKEPFTDDFKVFMIDFALCRFRRQVKDEEEWRKWQAFQDEEGAVGFVMQRTLKGAFVYRRSEKYDKLDLKFKSEGNHIKDV